MIHKNGNGIDGDGDGRLRLRSNNRRRRSRRWRSRRWRSRRSISPFGGAIPCGTARSILSFWIFGLYKLGPRYVVEHKKKKKTATTLRTTQKKTRERTPVTHRGAREEEDGPRPAGAVQLRGWRACARRSARVSSLAEEEEQEEQRQETPQQKGQPPREGAVWCRERRGRTRRTVRVSPRGHL